MSAVGYDGKEKTYFSVEDPTTASAILDAVTGQEYSINLLVAATFIVEAELGKFFNCNSTPQRSIHV